MKQKDFDKDVLQFAIQTLIAKRKELRGIGNGVHPTQISRHFKVHHKEVEESLKRSEVRLNGMNEFVGPKEYEITREYVDNLKL